MSAVLRQTDSPMRSLELRDEVGWRLLGRHSENGNPAIESLRAERRNSQRTPRRLYPIAGSCVQTLELLAVGRNGAMLSVLIWFTE